MKGFRRRMLRLAGAQVVAIAGFLSVTALSAVAGASAADDGKLRIICFGAHPDDCELQAGGVAAMWAAKGHKVKFVSVTNGDIGHWRGGGGRVCAPRERRARARPPQ